MDHFAGLDVSVKDTSICIVDDTGRITREVKVASEPDAFAGRSAETATNRRLFDHLVGVESRLHMGRAATSLMEYM
jgi:predicted NBD/HSP70 family sugar kinase